MVEPAEQAARDALAFAESIIDPLLVLDGGLRVVSASPEFYRTFGVTREETEGRLVYDLGNRQWDIPRLRVLLEEILPQNNSFRDFEVEQHFEHIGRKVMLLNARRLRRGPGEREMILLAIEDATARRDAEEARREAETRFTEMVKNVRDHSIFLTDPNGVITSWNVAAERVIGYSEAEAVGKHYSLIFTPEDVQNGLPELELRTAREKGRAEDERWHKRKDGGRFWALGIVTPLCGATGKLTGYSKILRDMTERKHAEEDLRESEGRLKGQKAAFEAAVGGAPLEACLDVLIRAVTERAGDGVRAGFYLVNDAGTCLRPVPVAGGISESYTRQVDGFKVGLDSLACGLAAASGSPVITSDVFEEPRWGPWRHLAREFDFRGCWSFPIQTHAGRPVGTFAMYHRQPREATPHDLALAGAITQAAAIIISRHTEAEARRRAEAALRESEGRLRLALAAARMGIWTLELPTGTQTRGPNLNRLLGLGPAETTQPFEEFLTHVHPDDRPAVREAFAASMREGRPLNVEFRVVRPDGAVRWLRDQGDIFGDAASGARRMAGACIDITEGKEAEARVKASEERLRQVLASAIDFAIITLDAARRVTGWSPGAEAVFGWSEAEMLGRSEDEVFTPEDRTGAAPEREAEQARREGRAADERWHVRKGGQRFYAAGVMTPLGDGGFVKVLRDLTDRKRMEDELRDAGRRKDEFLAMLGHELRNPLAPLRSLTEVLRRQRLGDGDLDRVHAMMERQVGHLTRLVDDLLDVSRITRGLVELRKEPVDLAEVADQAVEMVTPAVEGRGHDLNLSLPRKPLRVEGDATRLTQVIFNLLNNAAKYTDPGGRIWLTVQREGGQAVVTVRDNGSGMKAELLPRVFDLFTQGDRALDRSQGGLGLGLTLVKRLVEMHGGTVEARSAGAGKGSGFTVRLPALPAEEPKPQPARPAGPSQPAVQVARALVVDDNIDVAESMAWMLEGLAEEIKMVHSGPAALEAAPEFRPDVILCDIGMAGMDGYEACRRLRAEPGLEKVLIAAVSGYGGEEDRRRSKEAGFDRHLVKPVGRATLEELVQSAADK